MNTTLHEFAIVLSVTFLAFSVASADPNPLLALDVESLATQVASSEVFREEVRKAFGTLTQSSQGSARRLIDAMSSSQRMQASGTPIDGIVAKHLSGIITPLLQDAETKSLVQLRATEGRLDLLLAACSAATKPTVGNEPKAGQKLPAAQKKLIEKAVVGHFLGPADREATHYFMKDGTLLRFDENDPSKANVFAWRMLDSGIIGISRFGFHDFLIVTTTPELSVQLARGVYVDGQPRYENPIKWKIDSDKKLPSKYSTINR